VGKQHTINTPKVDLAIESECQSDCEAVTKNINELELGVLAETTEKLNKEKRKCLLNEIKVITQAYK